MGTISPEKKIRRVVNSHRKWLDRNEDKLLSRELGHIDVTLDEQSLRGFMTLPSRLQRLGLINGVRGLIDLIDGQPLGWHRLSASIDFHGLAVEIASDIFFIRNRQGPQQRDLTLYVGRIGCLMCVSEKWESFASSLLKRIRLTKGAATEPYWSGRPFDKFMLACYDFVDGIDNTHPLENPYGLIFEAWDNEQELADAMNLVCDYHVQNMEDIGNPDWDPEFKHPPFDLIPCEILMIRRLRDRLGLETPSIDHPLLWGDMATINEIPTADEDGLIEQIRSAYRQVAE